MRRLAKFLMRLGAKSEGERERRAAQERQSESRPTRQPNPDDDPHEDELESDNLSPPPASQQAASSSTPASLPPRPPSLPTVDNTCSTSSSPPLHTPGPPPNPPFSSVSAASLAPPDGHRTSSPPKGDRHADPSKLDGLPHSHHQTHAKYSAVPSEAVLTERRQPNPDHDPNEDVQEDGNLPPRSTPQQTVLSSTSSSLPLRPPSLSTPSSHPLHTPGPPPNPPFSQASVAPSASKDDGRRSSPSEVDRRVDPSKGEGLAHLYGQTLTKYSEVPPGAALTDIQPELGGQLTRLNASGRGGYSDVYQGLWTGPDGKEIKVAIKVLRLPIPASNSTDREKLRSKIDTRMKRETLIWTWARHPHVHTFLGFRLDHEPQLISPWCARGNLNDYISCNASLSRGDKLGLIHQAGLGLAYLHQRDPPICHGDIKPENILINDSLKAVLSDFGVSRVIDSLADHTGLTTTDAGLRGTYCYAAPELFNPQILGDDRLVPVTTCETDVFAFGGVILTTMSRKAPFHRVKLPYVIITMVTKGKTPEPRDHEEIPDDDTLWAIMRQCWSFQPSERPSMEDILGQVMEQDTRGTDTPVSTGSILSGLEPSVPPPSEDYSDPPQDIGDTMSLVQPGLRILGIAEELGGKLAMSSDVPILAGGHADVYQGIWTDPEGEKIEVAVKTLRVARPFSLAADTAALKKRIDMRMKRETLVWTRAKHRNINPLLGFRSQPEPQLISLWCPHGNLIDYSITNPKLSILDKLRLLLQAARGLAYLHSQTPPMCHGAIKPENVLVNDSKEAALADFGLSQVLQSAETRTGLSTSDGNRGSPHYMAMELFAEDIPGGTCESDVYAFGCLILKVMSGKAPFEGVWPGGILLRVIQGKQPEQKDHPSLPSSDPLWELMRECWASGPEQRPPMSVVVAELEKEVDRRMI